MAFTHSAPKKRKQTQEESKESKLGTLPDPLIANGVFAFFSGKEQAKMTRVSKRWKTLSSLPYVWNTKLINEHNVSPQFHKKYAEAIRINTNPEDASIPPPIDTIPKNIYRNLSNTRPVEIIKKLAVYGDIDLMNHYLLTLKSGDIVLLFSVVSDIIHESLAAKLYNIFCLVVKPQGSMPIKNIKTYLEDIEDDIEMIPIISIDKYQNHACLHLLHLLMLQLAIFAESVELLQWLTKEKNIKVEKPELLLEFAKNIKDMVSAVQEQEEQVHIIAKKECNPNPEIIKWLNENLVSHSQDNKRMKSNK